MKENNSVFVGALFIVAAILIVLNRLGYTMGIGIFEIVCSVVLVACLLNSIVKLSFSGMIFSVAFLLIIWAGPLGIPAVLIPWPLIFVAALSSIGLNLMFKNNIAYKSLKTKQNAYSKRNTRFSENVGDVEGDYVNENNTFGGTTRYIKSQNLMHMDLSNSFGELKVYLDNADIKANIATIVVNNSFGETCLYIPRHWKVESHLICSFGHVSEDGYSQGEVGPTVVIEGKVSFGELRIIYV